MHLYSNTLKEKQDSEVLWKPLTKTISQQHQLQQEVEFYSPVTQRQEHTVSSAGSQKRPQRLNQMVEE